MNRHWRARARRRAGYSLLEVMITLAVMALATSLILPGLNAGLRSAARHAAGLELDQQLLALRRQALSDGRAYVMGGAPEDAEAALGAPAQVRLPEGWAYRAAPAIVFSADGACSEGTVTLVKQGRADQRFRVAMPTCRPVPI